jgi:predicted RNase H-like HicB family nuclease
VACGKWLVGIPKSKSPGESPLGQRAGLKPLGPVVAPAAALYAQGMKTTQYIHWQHGAMWIGYLVEFPDYWTQGETHEELVENLKDLHQELVSGQIPEVRRLAELHIA